MPVWDSGSANQRETVRLPEAAERLLASPHPGIFSTVRPDGSVHATPVRFSWDSESGLVRIMTVGSRTKARNIRANPSSRVAICQAADFRWIALEGVAVVLTDPDRVAEGKRRYVQRYLAPPPAVPGMVVIEMTVDHVMGLW
jgi:F420H(2)-dependent biliverdin reductase